MNLMKNKISFFLYVFVVLLGCNSSINAQDLLEKLDEEYPNTPQYETATFKTTQIAIGQSVENRKKGVLQLMALSRYWNIPNTRTQSFITDRVATRFGVEYGITNNFTTGIGWTSFDNAYNGYFKYNLLRQRKKPSKAFASIAYYQSVSYYGDRSAPSPDSSFNDRLSFTSQLLIARKFTPKFSMQIAPTFIHRNKVAAIDPSNYFALGFSGRYKIANHVSLVSEYYYVANPIKSKDTYGAFALGINWDIRYLMLQFHMTNTWNMIDDDFILNTPNNFNGEDGNFVFGFNAIFTLHFKKNKL